MPPKQAIVIGAGIAGLALARALAEKGYKVTVFERNAMAVGASVRNFGMIWPIGQPNGALYERALRSRSIWKQVCEEAGLWYEQRGSLHLAYNDPEMQVINEFAFANRGMRPLQILSVQQTADKSEAVNTEGLLGALYSEDEMIVEAREAIKKIPALLQEKYQVTFYFNTAITEVNYPFVSAGDKSWSADEIFICSGAEFETLYPEIYQQAPLTKCKLQMMRLENQPGEWRIGPSLCGGLSLTHYKAFEVAPSLPDLKNYFKQHFPDHVKWGIHVMVSQNGEGALTIGDSHEYGAVHDPFDRQFINQLILDYLKKFAVFKSWDLMQSWNGIYPKMTDGSSEFIFQPEAGVTIVNGLGGAGMTLSFGLAEELINEKKVAATSI